MTITPTPVTAALAGIVSSIFWPLAWSRYGGTQAGGAFSIELILATLLLVALPAHAFVVGFSYRQAPGGRAVDVELLKRVGAWLLAAGITVGLVALYRA